MLITFLTTETLAKKWQAFILDNDDILRLSTMSYFNLLKDHNTLVVAEMYGRKAWRQLYEALNTLKPEYITFESEVVGVVNTVVNVYGSHCARIHKAGHERFIVKANPILKRLEKIYEKH